MVSTTPRLRPGEQAALDRAISRGYLIGDTPATVTEWVARRRSRALPEQPQVSEYREEEVGVDDHL